MEMLRYAVINFWPKFKYIRKWTSLKLLFLEDYVHKKKKFAQMNEINWCLNPTNQQNCHKNHGCYNKYILKEWVLYTKKTYIIKSPRKI